MTPDTNSKRFYGWFALSGGMLVTLVIIGTLPISFGVFLPVMCDELGWSRATLSAGFTVGLLCNGLPSPLWGFLVSRYGPRRIMIVGTILLALGLAGMSLVQEIWHIYVFFCLAGVGIGFAGMISTATMANNWFSKKRSLAQGLLTASGGVGGFVFPPLTTALISSLGWRSAWLILAAIVIVVATVIGAIILSRGKPEDMGQLPDGEISATSDRAVKDSNSSFSNESEVRYQVSKILKNSTVWLIAAYAVCFTLALGTINSHQVAYMQDLGFSPMTAAATLSLISGMGIAGSLGFGTLAMKLNIRYLAVSCFVLQFIALCLLLISRDLVLIYLYTIVFGVGNGGLLASLPTTIGTYYGRAFYPQVMGLVTPFQVVAYATAASIAGVIFDITGSYDAALILLSILSLVGLACVFFVRPTKVLYHLT